MAVSSTVGRMRSSAGLLIAVSTMVTVACTLVALVPVYSTAIVEAGLRGTVADAEATDRAIDVTTRAAADSGEVFASLDGDALEPTADAFRSARFAESGAYRVADPPVDVDPTTGTSVVTSLATFAGDDLLRTVSGDLDRVAGGESGPAPWPAALHVDAAELLGIEVGDAVRLEPSGAAQDLVVDLTIVAVLEPVDPADARWFGQPLGRLGTSTSGSFTEVGPFFVTDEHFAQIGGDATFTGRYALDESTLDSDDVDALIATVGRAEDTFATALAPRTARVATDLDGLLSATDTSVRSTGAVVASILLQLAAVALYGLGVAASVLVASRRSERVLVHSRGISTGQVGRDAALEAAAIALPAAIVGPFLAVAAVGVVGSWGPLEASGLDLRGRVSAAAFALALLAALGAIVIIVWPAVSAARSPTSETADPSRPPFLRRTGLDIVLFVVAVLGLWQLHRTGSVATSSSPDARASVDPVLVLAPTLGVAAASLLAVRLLAVGATLLERAGTRSRRLAPALAGWEAAREGSRRNRSSVLIVVAVAVATFALVHAVSWERSQQDQAAAAVGADVVVAPDQRADAGLDPVTLPAAYRSIDGVDDVTPVDRRAVALTRQFGAVPIIAVDATRFDDFSRLRPDAVAPSDTIASLSSPPDLDGVTLPADGGEVSATFTLEAFADDVETGERTSVDVDVDLAVVVVDEFGAVRRLGAADAVTSASGPSAVSFGRLEPSADERRPPRLVEVEVTTLLRFVDFDQDFDFDDDGTVDVDPFSIAGFDLDLTMTELTVDGEPIDVSASTWDAIAPLPGPSVTWQSEAAVSSLDGPAGLAMEIQTGTTAQRQFSGRFRFVTAILDPDADPPTIDVIATPDLIDGLGLQPGDSTAARIGSLRARLRVVAASGVIPYAVGEEIGLLVDHATLAGLDYLATGSRSVPERWALRVEERDREAVTATLRALPYSSVSVEDRWARAEQRTRDPVLLGLTGSLLLAIVAVTVVALVGLAMSAVTGARERRSAHAVLRALGASRGELRRWLARETIPLGVGATMIGAVTGVVIATLVLTSLTGDRDGSPAIPPPELVIPWTAVGVLVLTTLGAVALLPVAMSRLLRGVRPAEELRIGDER